MRIENNILIAECTAYDFKGELEKKKIRDWLKSGSTITVSVSGTGSKSFAKKVITPTKDISLAAGKMYRTSELVLE